MSAAVTDPWAWGRGSAALCCCSCQVGTAGQADEALMRGARPCGGGIARVRLDRLVGIGLSGRRRRGRWSFWAEGWAPVVRAGLGSWVVRRKEARGGLG